MLFASSEMSFSTFLLVCAILLAVGAALKQKEKEKKAAAERQLYQHRGYPPPPSFKRKLAMGVGSTLLGVFMRGMFGHHGHHHHG